MYTKLPDVNLTGQEISDEFFFYADDDIFESAKNFLMYLPSLKEQGYTVEMLIEDYNNRL